jgi:hypothetical protein
MVEESTSAESINEESMLEKRTLIEAWVSSR